MTALEQLTYTVRHLPLDEIGRAEAEKQCREAEQEQTELVAALVSMAEAATALYDERTSGRVVILVDAIEQARKALARFPSPVLSQGPKLASVAPYTERIKLQAGVMRREIAELRPRPKTLAPVLTRLASVGMCPRDE